MEPFAVSASVKDSVVTIPLTRGYEAVIDVADLPLIAGRSWNAHVSTRTGKVYAAGRLGRGSHYDMMHHVILGVPYIVQIDHIDGDGLNNRRMNMRLCTNQQNSFNRRKRAGTTSIYKGVSRHVRDNCWRACIARDGKRKHLGCFTDEVEAARAYDAAARELFGEFCRLNLTEESPLVAVKTTRWAIARWLALDIAGEQIRVSTIGGPKGNQYGRGGVSSTATCSGGCGGRLTVALLAARR